MEDVLEVYRRPYDKNCPVVCMDEKPIQLLADSRKRIPAKPSRQGKEGQPAKPGTPEKIDSEYVKNGTCSIFLFTEPLSGWRMATAYEHRTRVDWAHNIKYLLDVVYPAADKVILVSDNLNTHTIASLYATFPAPEALKLAKRIEMHHTPVHGSWLNIAECELSAMSSQCLGKRRIDNLDDLNRELSAWYVDRNTAQKGVDWQFKTEDARIKLKRLYPVIS